MDNKYIDDSINLEGIYEQCNEHLREQDRKRDQLLAFFGSVLGLILANIESLSKLKYIEFIYLWFILITFILAFVMINYMKWHSIYNYSAITLQNIMLFKHINITQNMVNAIYNKVSQNNNFNVKYYLNKTETKIFNVYLTISVTNIFIYVYFLSLKTTSSLLHLIYIIGAFVISFVYFFLMNIKAYNVLKCIFKPTNIDHTKVPSWIINLYDCEVYLCELLKKDREYKFSTPYYEAKVVKDRLTLINKSQGIAILPMTDDQKVLLIKIQRSNIKETVLEIPRGFLEENETHSHATKRELKEETNCEAVDYVNLGYIHPDSEITSSKIQLYLAKGCKVDNIRLQDKEPICGYELIDLYKVIEKINNGEINDSFTIAAIFRAWHYIKRK